jgi:hypothetical protein
MFVSPFITNSAANNAPRFHDGFSAYRSSA